MGFFQNVNEGMAAARNVGTAVENVGDVLESFTGRSEPRKLQNTYEDDNYEERGEEALLNNRRHTDAELKSRAQTDAMLMITAVNALSLGVRFGVINLFNNPEDDFNWYQYNELTAAAERKDQTLDELQIKNEYLYQQFYIIVRKCKEKKWQWDDFQTENANLTQAYADIETYCHTNDIEVIEFPKSLFEFKGQIRKGQAAEKRRKVINAFSGTSKNDLNLFREAIAEARYYELLRKDSEGELKPISSMGLILQIVLSDIGSRFIDSIGQSLVDGGSILDIFPESIRPVQAKDNAKYEQFVQEYRSIWGERDWEDASIVADSPAVAVSTPQTDSTQPHQQREELPVDTEPDEIE